MKMHDVLKLIYIVYVGQQTRKHKQLKKQTHENFITSNKITTCHMLSHIKSC